MLFCAPLQGNPPLSRLALILATQAGPQRALSDLIHYAVCPSVHARVCVSICACINVQTFWRFKADGTSCVIKKTRPCDVSVFLSFFRLFLSLVQCGAVRATGELLMREGIVVLLQIAHRFLQEKSRKEGKHEIPNIRGLLWNSRAIKELEIFFFSFFFFFGEFLLSMNPHTLVSTSDSNQKERENGTNQLLSFRSSFTLFGIFRSPSRVAFL